MSEVERLCKNCEFSGTYDKSTGWQYDGVCHNTKSKFDNELCDSVKVCGQWQRKLKELGR